MSCEKDLKELKKSIESIEDNLRNIKEDFETMSNNPLINFRVRAFNDIEYCILDIGESCKTAKKLHKKLEPCYQIIDYEAPERFYGNSCHPPRVTTRRSVRKPTTRKTTRKVTRR